MCNVENVHRQNRGKWLTRCRGAQNKKRMNGGLQTTRLGVAPPVTTEEWRKVEADLYKPGCLPESSREGYLEESGEGVSADLCQGAEHSALMKTRGTIWIRGR